MTTNAASRQKAKAAKGVTRSSKTGRFVTTTTAAARHPRKMTTERVEARSRKSQAVVLVGLGDDLSLVTASPEKLPQTAVRTAFLIEALGSGAEVARLLGVNRSQPSQWRSGKESPSPKTARQLLDLDYVMAKALQIWPAEAAVEWLHGSNDFLDGARPIDVLKRRGATEIIKALDAEMA